MSCDLIGGVATIVGADDHQRGRDDVGDLVLDREPVRNAHDRLGDTGARAGLQPVFPFVDDRFAGCIGQEGGTEHDRQHRFSQWRDAGDSVDSSEHFVALDVVGVLGSGAGVQKRQRADQFGPAGGDALPDEASH